jgi:hypothetical protein
VNGPEEALRPVTVGEVAQRFGGYLDDDSLPAFLREVGHAKSLNKTFAEASPSRLSEVPQPGDQFDVMHYEDAARQQFFVSVGRPPSRWELIGVAVAGCEACGRNGGLACDGHARRLGSPIPVLHAAPSREPNPNGPPYDIYNSVK